MTISELIKTLETLKAEHGDVIVEVDGYHGLETIEELSFSREWTDLIIIHSA